MSNYNRLIAYGSSPINGTELPNKDKTLAFPAKIAMSLGLDYVCRGKPLSSNSKISRKVLGSEHTDTDFVFVLWSSPNRYEFKTEQGWNGFTVHSDAKDGLIREWLDGPGKLEYTEVYMSLKDIALTQAYLKQKNLPYLFSMDNNAIKDSYCFNNPDPFLASVKSLIDWDKVQWFNNNGFINWAKQNGFPFTGTHAGTEAHTAAANYVLSHWMTSLVNPTESIQNSKA